MSASLGRQRATRKRVDRASHSGPVSIRRRRVQPPLMRSWGLEARRRRPAIGFFSVQPLIIAQTGLKSTGVKSQKAHCRGVWRIRARTPKCPCSPASCLQSFSSQTNPSCSLGAAWRTIPNSRPARPSSALTWATRSLPVQSRNRIGNLSRTRGSSTRPGACTTRPLKLTGEQSAPSSAP